jgi:DNA-binding transcriptional LysR family regulator
MDAGYRIFATPRQEEFLDAIEKHRGSFSAAAAALGINKSAISHSMKALRAAAARKGYSPAHDMTRPVAPGFQLRGTSTLYNKAGEVALQWVKTTRDHEAQAEAMRAAAEAMSGEVPRAAPVAGPDAPDGDLLNLMPINDLHVGMLAWRHEAGADWDLAIAERTLLGCFGRMVAALPPAHAGIVALNGDFLHWDGLEAVTPTSRHVLDADGRFPKIAATAIRLIRSVVSIALERNARVRLLVGEGNHDTASSVWLRQMFAALYEAEPRLSVSTSPLPYYAYQHGRTMLAFHHGHLKKPAMLPGLFAAEFPAIWGATRHRYAHVGHLHHAEVKESPGMVVEQHQTLAARDAYAARHGYQAQRGAVGITYHRDHGEVGRVTVRPEMAA